MFFADVGIRRKAQADFPNDAHKIIISGVFRRGVIYPNAEAYVRFGRGSLFGNLAGCWADRYERLLRRCLTCKEGGKIVLEHLNLRQLPVRGLKLHASALEVPSNSARKLT